MKARISIASRVRSHERQAAGISKLDERVLCRFLDRIVSTRQLNVEPVRKDGLQAIQIGFGLQLLAVGNQAGKRSLGARRKCDQAFAEALERSELDMRLLFDGPVKMSAGDELAQIVIAL